ncbi:PTS transporter subunit EIIC [Alkalibacterium indicireducens]
MNAREVAENILLNIGGEENIRSIEHCATRLRLVLNDSKKIDEKKIEDIEGVKGMFHSLGQYQIILGTGFVNKVYNEIVKDSSNVDTDNKSEVYKDINIFQKVSRTLGDVFLPIIPILVATGLFMGLRGLLLNLDINLPDNFILLSEILTDTAFAFLPALVGYSVMKKFGGSPIVGFVIGLMLVAPQLPNAHAVGRGDADPLMLSLGALSIPVIGYQGSVLPALVVSIFTAKVEKNLRKIVPDFLDLIVTPFFTLLAGVIAGLLVIGPIMYFVEGYIISGFEGLMNIPFGIGGAIVAALQQVIVITGLHHAFRALEIDLLASTGGNAFNALSSGAIAAQAGAALAVVFKTKDLKKRSLYLTSALPAFFGITEPAIFGVNLRLIKPFIFGCFGAACAGLYSSLVGLEATGLAITMIPGALLYLDGQLTQYFIAMFIGLATAFALTFFFYKSEED